MDWKAIRDYFEQFDSKSRGQHCPEPHAESVQALEAFLAARAAEREADRMKTEAYLLYRGAYVGKFKPYTFGATKGIRTTVADRYLDSLGIRHNDTDPR